MRHKALLLGLAALLTAVVCTGCAKSDSRQSGFSNPGDIHVVSTLFVGYDFARQIGAGNAEALLLLKPGSESHSFEPTPKDLITIEQCDVFICTGGENDAWVDTMLDAIDNPDMRIIRMTECIDTLLEEEVVEGMQSDEHEEHEDGDDHEEWDEHVWMDISNAVSVCEAIAQTYGEIDPEHSQDYLSACEAYKEELEGIDADLRNIVDTAARKELIFADRFPARYFTERYGLDYYAAFPGCSENTEASASTIAFLIDKTREDAIPAVLTIELSAGKLAEAVSKETGAGILTFYTGHNVTADDFEAGLTYAEMMRRNAETLRTALN